MSFLFVGDWMPRRALTENVGALGDCVVGNLECAFSDDEVSSGKAYTSVLTNECLQNVGTGGFAALSVANNHVNDASDFDGTLERLTNRHPGIQFFGTVDSPYAIFDLGLTGRVIVIGCLEPCRSRGGRLFKQEDVESLIRKLRMDAGMSSVYIFVYPHWGMEGEYTRYPSPKQRALARRWIDAGADGVVGSHSHVPQGHEFYKGKPIYYSLGNFDFDHPESKLYAGTADQMIVEFDGFNNGAMVTKERFSSADAQAAVEMASAELVDWTTWRWARMVGPFNLRKNMASWKLRLCRNPLKALPKFLVWQFLPQVLLFRLASCFPPERMQIVAIGGIASVKRIVNDVADS